MFDYGGNLVQQKNGLWLMDMDINSVKIVEDFGEFMFKFLNVNFLTGSPSPLVTVPELKGATRVDTCDDEVYCGLPYILPVLNFLWISHWLETPPFQVPLETTVNMNTKALVASNVLRLNFTLTGPDHMNLMFSPMAGFSLKQWSIDENKPLASSKQFKRRNMYFVYYSYGLTKRPWNFYLDFEVPESYSVKDPIVDLSVNGQFFHGDGKSTEEMRKFVSRLPDWTTTSYWTGTIRSHVF